MKLEQILVVLEPHVDDQPVLERAAFLARRVGARLHLFLCAFDAAIGLASLIGGDRRDLIRRVIEGNELLVRRLQAPLAATGIDVTSEVVWHRHPAEAIVAACGQGGFDLLIKAAAPHSRTSVRFSHIDWNLMRHAPCPVLLVKSGLWDDVGQVLAAIDPAPEDAMHDALNRAVLDRASALARHLSFDLHLVSAYPPPPVYVPVSMLAEHLDHYRDRMTTLVRGYLARQGARYGVVPEHQHAVEGPVDWVVPQVAEQLVAEFVVIGNVCRPGLTGISLGSAAESTLDALRTNVLMVRVPDSPA